MNEVNNHKIFKSMFHRRSFRLSLVLQGIGVGAGAGFLIVLYRYALEFSFKLLGSVYKVLVEKPQYIPLWIIALCGIGFLIGFLLKREPMISGSGIPQVEGVLSGKLEMKWYKIIINKFIGGVLSIGSGLSLGREGPSVQLGAAVGQGFSKIF